MQATFEGDDIFYPVSKTPALLTFNLEMTREDEWKEDGSERQEGSSGEASEEKFCASENEENGKGRDLFIVSMMKTRISVLKARCGEGGCTCLGCLEDNCFMNDVIVVAESRTVTLGKGVFCSTDIAQLISHFSVMHTAFSTPLLKLFYNKE